MDLYGALVAPLASTLASVLFVFFFLFFSLFLLLLLSLSLSLLSSHLLVFRMKLQRAHTQIFGSQCCSISVFSVWHESLFIFGIFFFFFKKKIKPNIYFLLVSYLCASLFSYECVYNVYMWNVCKGKTEFTVLNMSWTELPVMFWNWFWLVKWMDNENKGKTQNMLTILKASK